MKRFYTFVLQLLLVASSISIQAQTIGLQVDDGEAVLFGGDTKGGGAKVIWLPATSAFRAGRITGMQWDPTNIGFNSISMGYNTQAKGNYSTAMGYQTQATGFNAVAIGTNTLASGTWSTAMGNTTSANGPSSSALGFSTMANGTSSTAMGVSTIANGFASTVVGMFNDSLVSKQTTASGNPIPLFIVGNGNGPDDRSNAFVIGRYWSGVPYCEIDGSATIGGGIKTGLIEGRGRIGEVDSFLFFHGSGIHLSGNANLRLSSGDLRLGTGDIFAPSLPYGDRANMQYETGTGRFYYDNSSRRYKENIHTLEDDWRKILKTRSVKYTRDHSPDYCEYGYIAEEMDSIGLTNLVGYDQEGLPNDVRYDKMVLYLTELVKLQDQEIKSIKKQIDEIQRLKADHELLHKRIATLEDRLR
jgi:hypothetical protein